MSVDLVVPAWCDFFDTDEYAAFSEAVDHACGCYGAEGQDFDDGELCMYVGDRPEEGVLSLVALAAQCRDSPAEEWESICFARISAWVEGEAQREWLTQMPFAEVEPRLEVWLGDQHPVMYEGGRPGDPDEPFAMALAEGLHLSLMAEVPAVGNSSEMSVLVPNSAVEAWQQSADDLLHWARARLRQLPPPVWRRSTVQSHNAEGAVVEVDLYLGSAADGVAIPASAWALLLGEVAPEPSPRGALIAVPERDTLVFAPRREAEHDMDVAWALSSVSRRRYEESPDEDRVTPARFAYSVTHGAFQASLPEWNTPAS